MPKICFALPKYSFANIQFVREVKTGLDALDPILGQIRNVPVVHSGRMRQVSEPNTLETPMKKQEANEMLEFKCYFKTDTEMFRDFICSLQKQFSEISKKHLFEVVFKTTEATENVFNANGRNTWDAILEMTERTEMYFDEDGNNNYQFYVHPDTYKKLAENPPTPEQEKKMQEVMNKKREEFYAQKRIRRLS